jgi:hypothetical protein
MELKKRFKGYLELLSLQILAHIIYILISASLTILLSISENFFPTVSVTFKVTCFSIFFIVCYASYKLIFEKTKKKRKLLKNSGLFYFQPNRKVEDRKANIKFIYEKSSTARDISIIGATGYNTFAKIDIEGKAMLRECLERMTGEIKIILLDPHALQTKIRSTSLAVPLDKYQEEIFNSVEFLKQLKDKGQNISLKFYEQRPIWKMIILDNDMWLQYYHPRKHVEHVPVYGIHRDPNKSDFNLFDPLYEVFQKKWIHDNNPIFDFDSYEIVYRDLEDTSKVVKREPLKK